MRADLRAGEAGILDRLRRALPEGRHHAVRGVAEEQDVAGGVGEQRLVLLHARPVDGGEVRAQMVSIIQRQAGLGEPRSG